MSSERPVVIVTGVSGNLGRRLLRQLRDFEVVGVDLRPPEDASLARFQQIDLGREESCEQLAELLRETDAHAVVHLAFVLDPVLTGILEPERMWQINVAGTARVMEAISVVNRYGGRVQKFIFPSSIAVYGPETPGLVAEDHPLRAQSLPYALQKQECDKVVRYRQEWMGDTRTYLLRPAIFAGASVHNYMVGTLRGTPGGVGKRAQRMRQENKRLPLMLPWGGSYLQKQFQFVHVDDMARLVAYVLRREATRDKQCTVLNVAGSGEPVSIGQCAQIAGAKIRRVPNRTLCRIILRKLWDWGISSIPPEALPYMIGSYTMDTTRLRNFLGGEYSSVFRYSVAEALEDSFREERSEAAE